jgi:hypothetical protein
LSSLPLLHFVSLTMVSNKLSNVSIKINTTTHKCIILSEQDSSGSAQGPVVGCCEHSIGPSGSIRCWEIWVTEQLVAF